MIKLLAFLTILPILFLSSSVNAFHNDDPNEVREINRTRSSTNLRIRLPEPLHLKSISPKSGDFEEEIRLKGTSFGTTPGNVWFYNSAGQNAGGGPIVEWKEESIKIRVPAVAWNQNYQLEVEKANGEKSNKLGFFIERGQPQIQSISPTRASSIGTHTLTNDELITINGINFGDRKGKIELYLPSNGTKPQTTIRPETWTENQITFRIPPKVEFNKEYFMGVLTADGRHSSIKIIFLVDAL